MVGDGGAPTSPTRKMTTGCCRARRRRPRRASVLLQSLLRLRAAGPRQQLLRVPGEPQGAHVRRAGSGGDGAQVRGRPRPEARARRRLARGGGGGEEFIIERILSQTEVDDATFYLIQWKVRPTSATRGSPRPTWRTSRPRDRSAALDERGRRRRRAPAARGAEEEEEAQEAKGEGGGGRRRRRAADRSSSSTRRSGCRWRRTRRGCGGARGRSRRPGVDRRWRASSRRSDASARRGRRRRRPPRRAACAAAAEAEEGEGGGRRRRLGLGGGVGVGGRHLREHDGLSRRPLRLRAAVWHDGPHQTAIDQGGKRERLPSGWRERRSMGAASS